jgi:hypothetical protein
MIADNLKKRGWILGWVSAIDFGDFISGRFVTCLRVILRNWSGGVAFAIFRNP